MNTSTDMCGQGDKLTEPFLLEVVAHDVVLGGADVEVSNDQGVLARVDALPQMVDHLGKRFIIGPVYGYDGQLRRFNHHQLEVWLHKDAATASDPVLDIRGNSFSTALARKMSAITLQLVLLLLLLRGFQPGLQHKKDVALHQYGIVSDVLHVLAKGAGVEGAHLQPRCFWIHPIAGILVHRDFVHPHSFVDHFFVDCDFCWVQ